MSTDNTPETGLESLGTPAELRAPQPPIDEPRIEEAPADQEPVAEEPVAQEPVAQEPVAQEPVEDWQANKRHGIAGLWDTIAFGVQFALLSIYATADQPEQSDPVERLRRKYGRPPRKF